MSMFLRPRIRELARQGEPFPIEAYDARRRFALQQHRNTHALRVRALNPSAPTTTAEGTTPCSTPPPTNTSSTRTT